MFATTLLAFVPTTKDPYFFWSVGLVLALAIAVAIGIERWLAPRRYARTAGLLGAFVLTGLLAIGGNPAAAVLIWLIVAGLVLAFISAVLSDM